MPYSAGLNRPALWRSRLGEDGTCGETAQARDFHADEPNQRWVADTTYLQVPSGCLYLAVVIDLFSRMVVGWSLSALHDRHLVMKALDEAITRRCPGAGLMQHSDRGTQYASEDYQRQIEAKGITCSMSRRGNCLDNAVVESWNKTLKAELGERFDSPADAQAKLFDYIESSTISSAVTRLWGI